MNRNTPGLSRKYALPGVLGVGNSSPPWVTQPRVCRQLCVAVMVAGATGLEQLRQPVQGKIPVPEEREAHPERGG